MVDSCDYGTDLTAHAETFLRARRRVSPALVELRDNWYFLKISISSALKNPEARPAALPYLIAQNYRQRSSSPRLIDTWLAEGEHIVL